MSIQKDQELLDEVAKAYSATALIRLDSLPPDALGWINGKLCVNNRPIICLPIALTDTFGYCSVAHRELLLCVQENRWFTVSATDKAYDFVTSMMTPT